MSPKRNKLSVLMKKPSCSVHGCGHGFPAVVAVVAAVTTATNFLRSLFQLWILELASSKENYNLSLSPVAVSDIQRIPFFTASGFSDKKCSNGTAITNENTNSLSKGKFPSQMKKLKFSTEKFYPLAKWLKRIVQE